MELKHESCFTRFRPGEKCSPGSTSLEDPLKRSVDIPRNALGQEAPGRKGARSSVSAAPASLKSVAKKAPKRGPGRGMSREERRDLTRKKLFDAAAEIVGRYGYAEASIQEITRRAGVAMGTFYNYFDSRQDLLDQLLPTIGEEMYAHIRTTLSGVTDEVAREERPAPAAAPPSPSPTGHAPGGRQSADGYPRR